MKSIAKYTIVLALLISAQNIFSQESKQQQIDSLKVQKEYIVAEEKTLLKEEVTEIKKRLEKEEISQVQADSLKHEAATKRALNIENRTVIIDSQIALLERNDKAYFEEYSIMGITIREEDGVTNVRITNKERPIKYDRRTITSFMMAIGFNNAIIEGEKFEDSPYKFGGSHFFEMGMAWKTRVFKNSNFLRIKYGFSFQFNGLKADDNMYFVQNGNETTLELYPHEVKKAKLNVTNLVFPVHFEFGPSRKNEYKDYIRYSTRRQFKIGLGGYGGFKTGVYQKLKYKENGEKSKEKIKKDYNTNDLIYGISGYLAFNETALYVKYDLNTIFENQVIDQRNISIGLRFDMD